MKLAMYNSAIIPKPTIRRMRIFAKEILTLPVNASCVAVDVLSWPTANTKRLMAKMIVDLKSMFR